MSARHLELQAWEGARQQAEARRAAEARATRCTAPLTQARQALDPTWSPGEEGWGQAGGCLIL